MTGYLPRPSHLMHEMRGVISSTESCKVELENLGTAMTLERTCWHDRGRARKKKNGFLALIFCQKPSQ
jgi:hypothetical protein